jgi:hypothetical protein
MKRGKRAPVKFNAGTATIGGKTKYWRSGWEKKYARYLEWMKKHGHIADWDFECETFWFLTIKRGTRSYLPDFKVTLNNGEIEFHEVKGYMDAKSKTKIKRMAKYYPDVTLRIIGAEWFRANSKTMEKLIKDFNK